MNWIGVNNLTYQGRHFDKVSNQVLSALLLTIRDELKEEIDTFLGI